MRSSYAYRGETKPTRLLPMIAAALMAIMTIVASMGIMTVGAANASAIDDILCGSESLGANTEAQTINSPLNDQDRGYSKMSIQALYSNVLKWTTYNGTISPTEPDATINSENENKNNIITQGVVEDASKIAHVGASCSNRVPHNGVANFILGAANATSNITSMFVTMAVSPSFICQDQKAADAGNCLNLVGVIGGTGQKGLYRGLAFLAFVAVAVWAAWTGLAKRKLTSALGGVLGAVLVFGIGVIMMGNPLLIAQLPMRLGTGLGGCVVMGISGENCINIGKTENAKTNANTECYVDINREIDWTEASSIFAEQTQCIVWKAFVLDPWAIGQFGWSYDQLDTQTAEVINNDKINKDGKLDYWKNIKVSTYSQDGNPYNMCSTDNQYSYSNIALYQLDLMSDKHDCGTEYHDGEQITIGYEDDQPIRGNVYTDWTYIIDAMAAQYDDPTYSENYKIWAGYNPMGRIELAVTALVATLLATVPTLIIAAWSIVYLIVSILLTAFAPLFFLIGIVPDWGRDIFKNWLTTIAENIMRYLMSLLLLLIGMMLYGAVLGLSVTTAEHPMLMFGSKLTFIIIVTLFLIVYRKQITDMVGIKMGKGFSSKLTDRVKTAADRLGWDATNSALATATGFIGAPGVKKYENGSNKTATLTQNAANRIASAKRMYEYSKNVNATRKPYNSVSRQITNIREERSLKADQQRNWITQRLDNRARGSISGIAARYGFTIDQMEQLLKTDPQQALETVRQYHGAEIARIAETGKPINHALETARQRKQAIDELVTTAANTIGTDDNGNKTIGDTAASTIASSYTGGADQLHADLTAWNAYRQAAIAAQTAANGDTADRLRTTMETNKAGYQRVTNWSNAAKATIDRQSVQEWNAAHPEQTVKTMNGMKAISNGIQNDIEEEKRRQQKDERLLKNVHRVQSSLELSDRIKQMDSDKATYSDKDINTVNQLYEEMTTNKEWDPLTMPQVSRSLGQVVADASRQTVPFAMDMIKPTVELKEPERKKTTKHDPTLPTMARKLGIRTRTLARLQAQGHDVNEIKQAIPKAMSQYPHVSRDQAINQYYSD